MYSFTERITFYTETALFLKLYFELMMIIDNCMNVYTTVNNNKLGYIETYFNKVRPSIVFFGKTALLSKIQSMAI